MHKPWWLFGREGRGSHGAIAAPPAAVRQSASAQCRLRPHAADRPAVRPPPQRGLARGGRTVALEILRGVEEIADGAVAREAPGEAVLTREIHGGARRHVLIYARLHSRAGESCAALATALV